MSEEGISFGLHVGDIVRPKTNEDAEVIGTTWIGGATTTTEFEIVLVVHAGEDYHGLIQAMGYVLRRDGKNNYPYVWSANRVVLVRRRP